MNINDAIVWAWLVGGLGCVAVYWWLVQDGYKDLEHSHDLNLTDPELSEIVVRDRVQFYWMLLVLSAVITSIGLVVVLRWLPMPAWSERLLGQVLGYYGRWALLSMVYILFVAGGRRIRRKKRNLRPRKT